MQIENHKEEVPFSHYESLFRLCDSAEVTARLADVKWDGKEFYVNLLGREYAIAHPEYAIRALDGGKVPPLPTQTFLLRYLLEGKTVAWAGQWKTFREMPWGEMYIKPYTGRVLTRAAFTFGTRVAACLREDGCRGSEARRCRLPVCPHRRLSDPDSGVGGRRRIPPQRPGDLFRQLRRGLRRGGPCGGR